MQKIKKIMWALAFVFAVFSAAAPAISYAAPTANTSDSGTFICAPDTTNQSGNLGRCVNRIYELGLGIGGTWAVVMLVIAGYLYTTGNKASIDKAKDFIGTTVAGLLILFFTFILLNTIDPNLTSIQNLLLQNVQCDSTNNNCTPPPPPGGPPVSSDIQAAAQNILANSKIYLANVHSSGKSDTPSATALANIQDTAAGKQAARSSYIDGGVAGPGGTVALSLNMLNGIQMIAAKYSISVSEIAGGVHAPNSRHYSGVAFDINVINGTHVAANTPDEQAVKAMCLSLGATQVYGPENQQETGNVVHCAW